MIDAAMMAQADAVLQACRARGWRIATAESCTGGLIAAALTAVAGSSDVVDRGFVTYSNSAKTAMLGVAGELIASAGAVSGAVAERMAAGAQDRSEADIAVAVTGIAGPGGGGADKPVGLVWFAVARPGRSVTTERRVFPGDRSEIRRAAVEHALTLLLHAGNAQDLPTG